MDYLDCSIICNDITKFTELRIDILIYGIKTPTLSLEVVAYNSKGNIEGLHYPQLDWSKTLVGITS